MSSSATRCGTAWQRLGLDAGPLLGASAAALPRARVPGPRGCGARTRRRRRRPRPPGPWAGLAARPGCGSCLAVVLPWALRLRSAPCPCAAAAARGRADAPALVPVGGPCWLPGQGSRIPGPGCCRCCRLPGRRSGPGCTAGLVRSNGPRVPYLRSTGLAARTIRPAQASTPRRKEVLLSEGLHHAGRFRCFPRTHV